MKRKADIQSKIDSLWEEYIESITKVAEISWGESFDKDVFDATMRGVHAYQKLSALEWVLNNNSVGEI